MPKPRFVRALALLLVVTSVSAACGGHKATNASDPTTPPTTTSTSTTTAPPDAPKQPLTGLPSSDQAALARPALMVKIDNADGGTCDNNARPQIGIDQADIVYEILVEGITRFAAVFQSKLPDAVGPVRSARSSDIDIISQFDVPLLAWSGNNGNVGDELSAVSSSFINVGHSSKAGNNFYRVKDRCAPHNLLVHPADLYEFAKGQGKTPTPIFQYRSATEALPATAQPAAGVHLTTGGDVVYVWNGTTKGWDRIQRGKPHLAAGDVQISPPNVVVLEIAYKASSTPNSPQAVTVGRGAAHIYTDGKVIDGTWSRDADTAPWTLTDAAGAPIKLTPGSTWVALAQQGRYETLTSDTIGKYVKS